MKRIRYLLSIVMVLKSVSLIGMQPKNGQKEDHHNLKTTEQKKPTDQSKKKQVPQVPSHFYDGY